MNALVLVPPRSASPAEPGALRAYAVFLVLALVSWWQVAWRQAGDLGLGRTSDLALAAGLAIGLRLAGTAIEAGAYALWWRARGARLPYLAFAVALLALSVVDRLALSLAQLASRTPEPAAWIAAVGGLHLIGRGWLAGEPGLRAALGSIGALTLLRLAMTAWLQAAALRRGLGGPLLVTLGLWAMTRVALWWATDLLRGVSPLP